MGQRWEDIKGFENHQISNLGNVRAKNYNRTGITQELKKVKNIEGYNTVSLYKDGKIYKKSVARLVLEAFEPRDDMDLKVDGIYILQAAHINYKIDDDRLENLEWKLQSKIGKKGTDKQRFRRQLLKAISQQERQ